MPKELSEAEEYFKDSERWRLKLNERVVARDKKYHTGTSVRLYRVDQITNHKGART